MSKDVHSWTRADVLVLEGRFYRCIPNVCRVMLDPRSIVGDEPEWPFGVLWIFQGRVSYGVAVVSN